MEKAVRKTDNFLQAIKRYADEQRSAIRKEAEQIKEEKLKQAEIKAKRDSERLVKDKLEEAKNKETGKLAKLSRDGQRELFLERAKMTESVFKKAEEKLIEYTNTSEYLEKLTNSARSIAAIFGDEDCLIYVNEKDLKNQEKLLSLFSGRAEIQADKTIRIGGIKGYCKAKSIVADETLDSKLCEQKEWFIENSGLSVL